MSWVAWICSLIVIRIIIHSSTPRHLKFVRWCICWCVYVLCMLMCSLLFDNPSLRLIYCNLFTQTLHRWHTLFDVVSIANSNVSLHYETSYVASSHHLTQDKLRDSKIYLIARYIIWSLLVVMTTMRWDLKYEAYSEKIPVSFANH